MSKVDWITWKTDPKELIDSETINRNVNNKISEINSITNNIYENIKSEIDKGGLTDESLSIDGKSPHNTVANRIIKKIDDIKTISEQLKEQINSQVLEQKNSEKEQLIKAIEEKISEQEKILENSISLKNKITASNTTVGIKEVEEIINSTNNRLSMLRGRLEQAKEI